MIRWAPAANAKPPTATRIGETSVTDFLCFLQPVSKIKHGTPEARLNRKGAGCRHGAFRCKSLIRGLNLVYGGGIEPPTSALRTRKRKAR